MTGQAELGARSGSGAGIGDRDLVWQEYLELLRSSENPLLHLGEVVRTQMHLQVDAILDSTAAALGLPALPVSPGESPSTTADISETIGRRRATGGVHPAQSLEAASALFEVSLPVLVAWSAAQGASHTAERVATVLNGQLLLRLTSAARGYVDLLLGRVHSANQLERRSVSRYLHDIAASNVALGLQNLELWDMYRSSGDDDRANEKIVALRRALNDALRTVRDTSEYLRVDIDERGLRRAIEIQLDAVPVEITSSVEVTGPVEDLPPVYAQELFLIIREAIRNAVDHGAPGRLSIEVRAGHDAVHAVVADDGVGFEVPDDELAESAEEAHVGLDSMRERTELLAGDLHIASTPGEGTRIQVTVPLVRTAGGGRRSAGRRR